MAYDIIGDIHGHADKLEALLKALGYRCDRSKTYRHPDVDRTAIFVGDFIDRGPRQLDTINIVRRMVDAGTAQAVMGNHEFNAISWHTPCPHNPGTFLRPRHGAKGKSNLHQHAAFLNEVKNDSLLHQEIVNWFLTLPLWLDLPAVRVVHACWHQRVMDEIRPILTPDLRLTKESIHVAGLYKTPEFDRVEIITKGIEAKLPNGLSFFDAEGQSRNAVRVRWWDEIATTYRDLAILPDGDDVGQLPNVNVAKEDHPANDHSKPLFFGHYWMTGEPHTLNHTMACVDYSAAKNDGPLVCYRWDGEPELSHDKFLQVHTPGLIDQRKMLVKPGF